uniref:Uncharacterized protein n=1 Tax=Wuchereria bancrofti TaxID=6293 RepID=A0AAF5RW97_WUCBA
MKGINLNMPEVSNKIVVLFDGGAQAACISKKQESTDWNKNLKSEIVPIVTTVIDYFTSKVRVISIN